MKFQDREEINPQMSKNANSDSDLFVEENLQNELIFDEEFSVPFDANIAEPPKEKESKEQPRSSLSADDVCEFNDELENLYWHGQLSYSCKSNIYDPDVDYLYDSQIMPDNIFTEFDLYNKCGTQLSNTDCDNGIKFSLNELEASNDFDHSLLHYHNWKTMNDDYRISYESTTSTCSSSESFLIDSADNNLTNWAKLKIIKYSSKFKNSKLAIKGNDRCLVTQFFKKPEYKNKPVFKTFAEDSKKKTKSESYATWKAVNSNRSTATLISWRDFLKSNTKVKFTGEELKPVTIVRSSGKSGFHKKGSNSQFPILRKCSDVQTANKEGLNASNKREKRTVTNAPLFSIFRNSRLLSDESEKKPEMVHSRSNNNNISNSKSESCLNQNKNQCKSTTGTCNIEILPTTDVFVDASQEIESIRIDYLTSQSGLDQSSFSDSSVSGHSPAESMNGNLLHANKMKFRMDYDFACLNYSSGSGYMSDSYSISKFDTSIQCAPTTCNTLIQTSLEYPKHSKYFYKSHNAVDIGVQVIDKSEGFWKPYFPDWSRLCSSLQKKNSVRQARNRLYHSMFFSKTFLPNLKFLNEPDGTKMSVINLL